MRRKRRNKGILAGVLICFLLLSGAVSGCTAREAEGEGTDPSDPGQDQRTGGECLRISGIFYPLRADRYTDHYSQRDEPDEHPF